MGLFLTIPALLANGVAKYAASDFLGRRDGKEWSANSYLEVAKQVYSLATQLQRAGIGSGDKVALMMPSNPDWVVADMASLLIGAMDVPLYPTLSDSQAAHILNDSGSKAVFVADGKQQQKLLRLIDSGEVKGVKTIFFSGGKHDEVEGVHGFSFEDSVVAEPWSEEKFSRMAAAVSAEQVATIIYTSGTTGKPKGVLLTHKNITTNVEDILTIFPLSSIDRHLSFLPLSHVFARTVGLYLFCHVGGAVWYEEDINRLPESIKEVRPYYLISVPRLYEKMRAKILAKLEDAHPLRQRFFYWAMGVGREANAMNGIDKASTLFLFRYRLAEMIVFNKIKAGFGGLVKYFISGGAPLEPQLATFFSDLQMPVMEGYGLTEASPVICFNPPSDINIGTVGRAIGRWQTKLAEDGELLAKGPSVMLGYHNNEKATAEAVDGDGWLHTGDLASIDETGLIRITGRKKEIIILSGGKNIAPLPMEVKLTADSYIASCMIIGDGQKFISALICPDMERLTSWAAKHGVVAETGLVQHEAVETFYKNKIDGLLAEFAEYERVKRFTLLPVEFSIDGGELTPTMKVRRKVVLKKYSAEVEKLYC